MSDVAERPLRADARRNREAILKAAKKVFAHYGMAAQMDDVARQAKLGVGTLYRHFPTKDALVGALMADRFEQITAFVIEGLDDPDPWHGFTRSLWRGAELAADDRSLSQVFQEADITGEQTHNDELLRAAAELIRRGQEAGTIRADLAVDDIPVVMCGVMSAMHPTGGPDAWRRHLQLVIDGMRATPGTTPLP